MAENGGNLTIVSRAIMTGFLQCGRGDGVWRNAVIADEHALANDIVDLLANLVDVVI